MHPFSARNALLFTLVIDGHPTHLIWNIFYHFKVDDESLSLLEKQCEKLVTISHDLDAWSSGPYATFLRVCSRHTLLQLNHHWLLYSRTRNSSSRNTKKSIASAFSCKLEACRSKETRVNLTASRSAGPFSDATTKVLSVHFEHYWRTGTVFLDPADLANAKFPNPTFIYSLVGEGCAIHYGTYPLQGFHLASAFTSIRTTPSLSRNKVTDHDLVSCAQMQFQQWCNAFKAALSSASRETVVIRLFAGDALAFCRTLYHCHVTGSTSASTFLSAWKGTELILDGGDYGASRASAAPTAFNIIDTSNIMDHVGLLNILLAAIPLLAHGPSSTLYTESLRIAGTDASTSFVRRLCAEIPAISLLFGVAPVAYVSNFSSHSNVHEVVLFHLTKSIQFHERIAWKIPYFGDSIALRECGKSIIHPSFSPLPLARLLFDMYYRMFADEDLLEMLQSRAIPDSIIHYHRGTFASLLGFVKSRVQTDWTSVMEHLFDLLHADHKLILGSNNYQELCCQLAIRGTYCVDALVPGFALPGIDWSKTRFRGWTNIPPVSCLIIVVPRDKIKVLEDMSPGEIGSPMLQCEIRGSSFHNIFSSIQIAFGTVSIIGSGNSAQATMREDAAGWLGSSSLVVSMWVPSFNLAIDPSNTQVGLGIHSTPATAHRLTEKLGMSLNLFTVDVMNSDFVHVVSARPDFPRELDSLQASAPHSPAASSRRVTVELDGVRVSKLSIRAEIKHVDSRAEVEQISPCVLRVTIGPESHNLVYLFPINGKRCKLRIARQSRWIEVSAFLFIGFDASLKKSQGIVDVSGRGIPGGFGIQNFPLLLSENKLLTIWNIHRLNMKWLPTFDTNQSDQVSRIGTHVALSMSDRERAAQERGTPPTDSQPVDVLAQVKETIRCIFLQAIEPRALRIFGLTAPRDGVYTIIFLNGLRLDLASHTLVADTCVLPLTDNFLDRFGQHIANLTLGGRMIQIKTDEDEVRAWKQLLPVFAERCRSWSHKAKCEYVINGRVPLSVEVGGNPMCSCGEGVELGAFCEVAEWKKLARSVTRAAISPLFAESMEGFDRLRAVKKVSGLACEFCGKTGQEGDALLRCSLCKVANYCGKECQKGDWKKHKMHCEGGKGNDK